MRNFPGETGRTYCNVDNAVDLQLIKTIEIIVEMYSVEEVLSQRNKFDWVEEMRARDEGHEWIVLFNVSSSLTVLVVICESTMFEL
jgi:hypothetical protein